MSTPDDYDFKRARILLKDLEKSIPGHGPMLKLEAAPEDGRVIRGVANRSGLLRLGVQLAATALNAEALVTVRDDGTVDGDGQAGQFQIVLVDESPEPQRPKRQQTGPAYLASLVVGLGCMLFVIVIVMLIIIGLGTVLNWFGGV